MRPPVLAGVLLLTALGCDPTEPNLGDGGLPPCVPNASTNGLELCNGLDDDCDGLVDEGPGGAPLRESCSTVCGPGTKECVQGAYGACDAPAPSEEVCNGLDDDCNDEVDETCDCVHGTTRPCGSDEGACRAGIQQCVVGQWLPTCHGAVGPGMEVCNNGVDENCDGQIDEGCQCVPNETLPCGSDVGECVAGVITCGSDSQWGLTCDGEVRPRTEVCNGRDDNCDGEEDWDVGTNRGWRADRLEENDTCSRATVLPNAVNGGAWIEVPVDDPTNLLTFPTVYPPGDDDWYAFRAEDTSQGACFPGSSQCAFVLVVQLELGAGAVPADYEVCVSTAASCSSIDTSSMICSTGQHWVQNARSYVLGLKWGGVCGSDDSRDVKVVVRNAQTASACEYYQLYARFYFDSNESCP